MKAQQIDYSIGFFKYGLGYEPDSQESFKVRSFYIPSEHIFIERQIDEEIIFGPVYRMFHVQIGPEAEEKYTALLEKIKPATPIDIEVPDSLILWAKAMHSVKNPPSDISALLKDGN